MPSGQSRSIGGEKLRSLRQARRGADGRRLTIEGLAQAAGFDYRTISDIERGVMPTPALATMQRIFTAFEQFAAVAVEDKNAVLMAYGYQPIFVPPTDAEIKQTRALWAAQYCHMKLSDYLVTYTHDLCMRKPYG